MTQTTRTTTKAKAKPTAQISAVLSGELKEALLAEEAKLQKELAKFAKPNPHGDGQDFDSKFPQFGDKEDENAAEVAEYAANLTIEQDLGRALRDVKSALDRIKAGTYGICKYCEKPIEEKRLRARPSTSSCTDCKKAITQEV